MLWCVIRFQSLCLDNGIFYVHYCVHLFPGFVHTKTREKHRAVCISSEKQETGREGVKVQGSVSVIKGQNHIAFEGCKGEQTWKCYWFLHARPSLGMDPGWGLFMYPPAVPEIELVLCEQGGSRLWLLWKKASDAVSQRHSDCKHRGWLFNCNSNCQVRKDFLISSPIRNREGVVPVIRHHAEADALGEKNRQ